MKDANGTRFELLLGAPDWGRCTARDADGQVRALSDVWTSPISRGQPALSFDAQSHTLFLSRRLSPFRRARSETPPDPSLRLGAAADRWGSVYWIAAAGARVDVLSAGSRTSSTYAEVDPPRPVSRRGDFAPLHEPPTRSGSERMRGLAITSESYLVVGLMATAPRTCGLRVFDLLAGGPALELRWPASLPFSPYDMAARPCGGLAVLDRENLRVWLLDRRLGMRGSHASESRSADHDADFNRLDGTVEAESAPVLPPGWIDLVVDGEGGDDPIAVEVLPDGGVLVLDGAGTDGFALISLYEAGRLVGRASTRTLPEVLDADESPSFVLCAYDFALFPTAMEQPPRLAIAAQDGNQCLAFDLLRAGDVLNLRPVETFYPMRRFTGKGLVRRASTLAELRASQDTGLLYDSAGTWLPLVSQTRPRYAPAAELETPMLDSEQVACVWHRLLLDGCVPPGCQLRIETRAADTEEALAARGYQAEPRPMLRLTGSELPFLRDAPASDLAHGKGSWELLFQAAHGRYLQLRITLEGDELSTPRLFALRAWCPRFSYARRYLPAIYREDESSVDFLERFLANFEGIYTQLEDRIAALPALFDVRSAPADTLDWLASWLGLVFDESIDESRKRLLIRFALPLYAYRGTTQGVRLATELVTSACVQPEDFALPARSQHQPYGIRIVERYLTRRLPQGLLGEAVLDAPRALSEGAARWTTAEGAEGLHRRYRTALSEAGITSSESTQFSPVSPVDASERAVWQSFIAQTLGAAPELADALALSWRTRLSSLASDERHGMSAELPQRWPADPAQGALWRNFVESALPMSLRRWLRRWQAFLARRYLRMAAYAAVWGSSWPDFSLIPAPGLLPSNPAALADWALFETRLEPMERLAHRFSVLLPSRGPSADAAQIAQQNAFARRVVELEKPAHTVFDVRSYWAMFRIGQTRLGLDSLLGQGSRDPTLLPAIVIGSGHVGAGRVALQPATPRGRISLPC